MNRLAAAAVALLATPALAQTNDLLFSSVGVPTLDEVGLAGLIALVAAVGGWLASRRK
jgi:hypothetical protein